MAALARATRANGLGWMMESLWDSRCGSRLKGVQETGALLIGDFDGFPVEEIGGFFALDFAHEAASGVGAGIGGRFGHRFFEAERLPEAISVSQGESNAALGIDVMKLEVLRFEPGMAPFEAFALAEFAQQILFADPIDQSNEGTEIGGKAVQHPAPELEQFVAFGV